MQFYIKPIIRFLIIFDRRLSHSVNLSKIHVIFFSANLKFFKFCHIMNNSYLNYLRSIFQIFRKYKKCWNIRTKVDVQKTHDELVCRPETNIANLENTNEIIDNNANDSSSVSVEEQLLQSNFKSILSKPRIKTSLSSISLPSYSSYNINFSIKEKLKRMPTIDVREHISAPKLALKRSYPWQNFNVDDLSTLKYNNAKPINNLTEEMLKKKLVVRKHSDATKFKQKKIQVEKSLTSVGYPKIKYFQKEVDGVLLKKKPKFMSLPNVSRSDMSSNVPLKKRPKIVSFPYRSPSFVVCNKCKSEEETDSVRDILAQEANSWNNIQRQNNVIN